MNKQIEKFALQCGAWHQVYGNRNFMIDEHLDITKFAELFIQECIQKLIDNGYDDAADCLTKEMKNDVAR
jgi:hypothetical protein